MEVVIYASLALAFAISVALNIHQSVVVGRFKADLSDRDDLIEDLRSAISGVPASPDAWRKDVL